MKKQHHDKELLKNTDIFLLENSSCSLRQAHKFLQKFFVMVLILPLVSFSVTSVAYASTPDNYSGLVKCSGVVQNNGEVLCNFQTLIGTVQSLVSWMFFISVPIAVAIFAYAGLLYMSGKEGNKETAKTVFKNVAIGFIIMLVAYVVVQTLVGWLVNPGFGATTFLGS